MRKWLVILSLIVFVVACSVATRSSNSNLQPSMQDSIAKINLAYVQEVLASIKGKENVRVDSVFENIKLFQGEANFRAEHFVRMMNGGWSKALGVTCNLCHNTSDWASDEKNAKIVAREMWGVRQKLNKEIFASLTALRRSNFIGPPISCNTCHNGKLVPKND